MNQGEQSHLVSGGETQTSCIAIIFIRNIKSNIDVNPTTIIVIMFHFYNDMLVPLGVDTNMIVYSTAKYGCSDPRRIPAYPMVQNSLLALLLNIKKDFPSIALI